MFEGALNYYRQRAREEHRKALAAEDLFLKDVHLSFAETYTKRVQRLESGQLDPNLDRLFLYMQRSAQSTNPSSEPDKS